MRNLARNLRFGIRMLAQQPALSAVAILALALGIGLTTTMYSIVHGALRDLPFEEPEELLHLERTNPSEGIDSMGVSQHDYLDWREQQTRFEDLGGFYQGTVNVAGTERPIRYDGAFITPSTFRLIAARPARGRLFTDEDAEPGATPVLLLGHRAWRDDFHADPGVVGRDVRINGMPGRVIGVMPEGFRFPFDEDAWVPLVIDTATLERGQGNDLEVVGRLREGVTPEAALEELDTIAARLEESHPDTNEGVRALVQPYVREWMGDDIISMLWTMQGAVFMVLLIACANVANLLLSRAFDRSREVAVRTALGAGRWRIVSQLLTEVAVMAAIGGVLGLGIAHVGVTLFNGAIAGIEKPFWVAVRIDWTTLGFTTALVLGASLLAGLAPALKVTGSGLHDVLKDESRGSSGFRMGRLTRLLVVAEVALSCALLVGAGLMIKSVTQLDDFEYGYPTDVFTARVGLFEADYPAPEERRAFFEELLQRLRALPGVEAATLTDAPPGSQIASMGRMSIEGEAYASREEHPLANFAVIAPGFFETFEVELLQGRRFTELDTTDTQPVAIVNASFASRYFPGENPVGRRLKLGYDDDPDSPWLTVVGVAPDMDMEGINSLGQRAPQGLYLPLAQQDRRFMSLVVRTGEDSMGMAGPVRRAVAAVNPDLPIYWLQTLQTMIDQETWFYGVFGKLFAVFGAAALFLAAIGLYAVMSFSVRRRTREVGIRLALGADTRQVRNLVMRQGVWQIGLGLGIGVGLAMLAAGGLELVLFQVDPRDTGVYSLVLGALALTGLLATLLPASRASRTDPLIALRNE